MNRTLFFDRIDVLTEDLNAISDLEIYNLKTAIRSFLQSTQTGYVIRGLDVVTSATPNAFSINPGVAIDANDELVVITTPILDVVLADTTPGAVNVITLEATDNPDLDLTINPGPLVERVNISPRAPRGRDVNDPTALLQATRSYAGFVLHVDTQAAYDALTPLDQQNRINIIKLLTPPLVGGNPGIVDPASFPDPLFPNIIKLNLPPNSISPTSISGFGGPLETHQREAHDNFIYGTKADASLLGAIVTGVTASDFLTFNDVDPTKAFYIDGTRYIAGQLPSLDVTFNPVADPSGFYTVVVRKSASGSISLEKDLAVPNIQTALPIATVVWNATAGTLSQLVDIRNFISIPIDNRIFQFIAPLMALFGTGYFLNALNQLLAVSSVTNPYDVEISPGFGLAQDPTKTFAAMVSYPSGFILSMDPPDFFATTETIVGLTDSGDHVHSVVYTLQNNGFPHAVQNVVASGIPFVVLTENVNYLLNPAAGTIQFIFGGIIGVGSSINLSYEYGLPRLDLIILDQFGNFSKVKGVAAQSPVKPVLPAGTYEWAILSVRDLASSYLNTDLTVGKDYIPLGRLYNYQKNKIGFPELDEQLGSNLGVTGENLLSLPGETINERFQLIELAIGSVNVIPPPRLCFTFELTPDAGPVDVASFTPIKIAVVRRFSDQFRDLTFIPRVRVGMVYADNIPDADPIMFFVRIIDFATNALVTEFNAPSNDALSIDQNGICHFFSPWYEHDPAIRDIRVEVFINNSQKSKTNTTDAVELSNYVAKIHEIFIECWQFFKEEDI